MAQTLHARHTRDTDTDTRATAVNTMAWFILTELRPPGREPVNRGERALTSAEGVNG